MGVEAGAKAAIDLGTNTVLMVIGRKRADGSVEVLDPGGEPLLLGPGRSVGDWGALARLPRSADVVAGPEGVELFEVMMGDPRSFPADTEGFEKLLAEKSAKRLPNPPIDMPDWLEDTRN